MEDKFELIQGILEKWQFRKDFLIEILQGLQDEFRYLPQEALGQIARWLDIPLNQVYEVATYYKAFSLEPKGKFQISICQGTACHVQGAATVRGAFERELGIKLGETDRNLEFSLEGVRCLGCCGLAPVVTVNQDVYGKVEASEVPKIIEKYRKSSRQAKAVVTPAKGGR
ncbi:MAG: NADH-quinone oxidoreductase subunit NuoE family protein [Candidatus Aminicenantales bacterium]